MGKNRVIAAHCQTHRDNDPPSFLRSVLTADCGQTIRRAEADTSITLRAVVRGPPRAVLHINSSETPGNDGKEENLALGSAGKTADDSREEFLRKPFLYRRHQVLHRP